MELGACFLHEEMWKLERWVGWWVEVTSEGLPPTSTKNGKLHAPCLIVVIVKL